MSDPTEVPMHVLERNVELAALDHYSGDGGAGQSVLAVKLENAWKALRARHKSNREPSVRGELLRFLHEVYAPRLSPDQFEAGMTWIDTHHSGELPRGTQ